ncbi:hypothetical protein ABIB48_002633 [Arthrobacter sp. UYCu511]
MQVVRAILAFPLRILGQGIFMSGIYVLAVASRIAGVDYVMSLYIAIAQIAHLEGGEPSLSKSTDRTHQKEVI